MGILYTKKAPYAIPAMVDMTTMMPQKVAVFLTPMMLPITSMLGSESAGPASS
jgi:hypothetical protein